VGPTQRFGAAADQGGARPAVHCSGSGSDCRNVRARLLIGKPHVERAVEEQDEQAGGVACRLVPHHLPGGKMRIGTGADHAAVRVELPFEDDDCVRSRVQVRSALER